MRPKSVPLSVRATSSRRSSPTTARVPAGSSRNRRWRDVIATFVMVALVPAIMLPNSNADATIGPPTIATRSIAGNATGISIFSRVAVRFDRPVTGVGRSTFVLRDSQGRIIPATIGYDSTMLATLLPNDVLRPNSLYRVALSGSIRDASGTSLRWITWSFTTGTQPSAGVRFAPWRDVRFTPGTVTGIRVDGRGTVISSKVATLARSSWAAASGRATINGKTYLLIANGIWAGHYVPRSAIGETLAKAAVVPVPSTTGPTPAATASPSQAGSPTPTPASATPQPAPASTPTAPAATPTPQPPVVLPPTSGNGFLISTAEIRALPTSGAAWDALKRTADASAGSPNLADLNQSNNVQVLAKALVYARTGTASYRTDVIAALRAAIGTENGGRTLDVGRELAAYVISADLIGLRTADPAFDGTFRAWLGGLLDRPLADGNSLTETHERRPNNWGTHAGASRAAVAAYLGDTAELGRVAAVFRGWVGERASYAGFSYGDLAWQSNPSQPVGINPVGATLGGHSVDGVLPDDQRRTGGFTWPPPCGNYPHGALDGALLTAEILTRAGYPAYQWGSNGLLRAEQWLQSTGCAPSGDNVWHLPLLDARYGTGYWNGGVVQPGKNFGWTDWLYGR
jgi:Big-like domain-containing protein/alginate lyase